MEEQRAQGVRRDLERTEHTLDRLMRNINDAVYSVDAKTKEYSYVSPAFERLLGYSLEDIRDMGGRVAFLNRVIQGQAFEKQDQALDRMRAGGRVEEDRAESWFRCLDGTLKCFEDHWIPVYESGRLVSTDGVMRNITERKRSEEVIHERDDQLEDREHQITDLKEEVIRLAGRLGETPPLSGGAS